MKEFKDKKKQRKLITINNAAYCLEISKEIFPKIVADAGFEVIQDEWGALCISYDDFIGIHENPIVVAEANAEFRNDEKRRLEDIISGEDKNFLQKIQIKLTNYRSDINILEKIHAKYLPRFHPIFERKPLTAAYLLYARVINLLNMCCAAIDAGFWNAGLILRQIDETVDLAEYFSCSRHTPELQANLTQWFREDKTPRPSDIRKAIAVFNGIDPDSKDNNRYLYVMNELYDKKSKWVHPAFLPIKETIRTRFQNNAITVTGFDYGSCSYPRKLYDLTLFFKSSIWTAAQGFVFCFQRQIPLDHKDAECLNKLNRKFENDLDGPG